MTPGRCGWGEVPCRKASGSEFESHLPRVTRKWLRPPRRHGCLKGEQRLLAREPSPVTSELAVRTDDPVAGDNDPDRVATVRHAYRTGGVRLPDTAGELAVGDCGAVRDRFQLLPDLLLERRA